MKSTAETAAARTSFRTKNELVQKLKCLSRETSPYPSRPPQLTAVPVQAYRAIWLTGRWAALCSMQTGSPELQVEGTSEVARRMFVVSMLSEFNLLDAIAEMVRRNPASMRSIFSHQQQISNRDLTIGLRQSRRISCR